MKKFKCTSVHSTVYRRESVNLSFCVQCVILLNLSNMKAVSVVCAENNIAGINSGRVSKPKKDIENEEIQMYLSKLKDLVPFMPKNRKLSKLEVIQYVIDYICDLQSALETHPAVSTFDAAAALGQKKSQEAISPRQPLGLRASPNTILSPCEAPVLQNGTTPEKLTPSERQVPC
jgi:DNA-binding protein inhibitor ID